ncbi:FAS1 domain-containing protein [Leptodontidium sp. 2 PMI_412]|nr:FAS1 domain-containing protein [Leptodontidium sp. 2 PMI_412]
MQLSSTLLYLSCALGAGAQSFYAAISQNSQLSNFTSFFENNFPLASQLLTNSSTEPHTILVPNDNAFAKYESDNGYSITALSATELTSLIQYHVLVGRLSSANFSASRGLTAPSLLVGEQYNNRSAGTALSANFSNPASANGQVVFIQSGLQSSSKKFRVRGAGLQSLEVRSGLSSDANLTALDGIWDGGMFQMIDRFLTLPEHCSATIRNSGLSSLDSAITRAGIWDDLDDSANYTCIGPTDAAFANAQHPENNLNDSALESAMKMHTFPQVLYTNFLEDGQVYLSDNELKIQVTVKEGEVWFNDAKVVSPNVITNNGVVHVVDKVCFPYWP